MSWKVRLVAIGLAWIAIPWIWGVAAEQRRLRGREDAADDRS